MVVFSGAAMLAVAVAQPRFPWFLSTGISLTMEVSPDAIALPATI